MAKLNVRRVSLSLTFSLSVLVVVSHPPFGGTRSKNAPRPHNEYNLNTQKKTKNTALQNLQQEPQIDLAH